MKPMTFLMAKCPACGGTPAFTTVGYGDEKKFREEHEPLGFETVEVASGMITDCKCKVVRVPAPARSTEEGEP